jgi:hypothetical protein
MIPYGAEDSIPAAFDADAHRVGGRVLMMNLAATPETENHGAAIVAARDHVRRARPEPRLLVLVDESSYAARFGAPASATARLEERRRLWRAFVRGWRRGLVPAGNGAPPTGACDGDDHAEPDLAHARRPATLARCCAATSAFTTPRTSPTATNHALISRRGGRPALSGTPGFGTARGVEAAARAGNPSAGS